MLIGVLYSISSNKCRWSCEVQRFAAFKERKRICVPGIVLLSPLYTSLSCSQVSTTPCTTVTMTHEHSFTEATFYMFLHKLAEIINYSRFLLLANHPIVHLKSRVQKLLIHCRQ